MASAGSSNNNKRVLIIVQNLPVPFDRRVWLEALSLTEAGYQVSIICPKMKGYNKSCETIDGIDIYRYWLPVDAQGAIGYIMEFAWCWVATAWKSLIIAFIGKGFDVIHACNPPETFWLLALFWKLAGKKFIFDHHDLSPEMYLAKNGGNKNKLYKGLLFLEKMTFKCADIVITTNQSHKDIAIDRGSVKSDDVFIVRSGPDFDRLKVKNPKPALKEGYEKMACYLGEICSQDGVDLLMDCILTYNKTYDEKEVLFVVMGGGPSQNNVKKYAESLGLLDKNVRFTGRVSDDVLCEYLSTCDIGVDPSPYTEWANQSTMNKIMEYLTFAKPVVAFDLKESRVSAQEAAFFAKPGDISEMADLIHFLLTNPEKRNAMGRIGQKRVHEELAWDYSKKVLLKAYSYLFSKKGGFVQNSEALKI